MHAAPDYLNPNLPAHLHTVGMPVVVATNEALRGFGFMVDDPQLVKIEIVRWPSTGRRPVDADSGDEGGTAEGTFICEWKGDVLFGRNAAVGGHYLLGYAVDPSEADGRHERPPETRAALARQLSSRRRTGCFSP